MNETVAVINSTPDAVEMLRDAFDGAGYTVVSCFTHDIRDGKIDLDSFMRQHRPRVIVYDLAPPYERNFRLFEHVRSMSACKDAHFIITSMNPPRVEGMVGRDQQVYEVVDRADALNRLIQAVREATRARPTQ